MEPNQRGRGRGRRNNFRGRSRRPEEFVSDLPRSKPIFKTVEEICPEMTGVNANLKVIGQPSNSEFLMGDHTGSVVVYIHNNSVPLAKLTEGTSVIVRNAFVVMKNDAFIRLTVNEWGKVDVAEESFNFVPRKGNNISEVEYTIE